jgi:hypothetical protein
VYASDFNNAAKGPSTVRVYVQSGADGRRLFTLTGETAGEGFGIAWSGIHGFHSGRTFIISSGVSRRVK